MALDGILLYKLLPGITEGCPFRIQKIYQISQTEILFQTHGSKGKQQLLISCHSQYNRILLTKRSYPTPQEPGNFVMVLRKYLEGSTVQSIEQGGLDRWALMHIQRHNNLGDLEELSLYVELMGKYANVILVSSENKIIDALKRIPPFENSRRTVQPGAQFSITPSQNKKDPFTQPEIDSTQTLTQQFAGFSPFLASECEFRMKNGQSFSEILEEIKNSNKLYIANQQNEAVFHCIPLTSVGKCVEYPLFEGFDVLYFHKEEKDRIKQITGDLFHYVRRELKHQKLKLPRLLKEYDEATHCEKWKQYGDLLYGYQIQDTKGESKIILKDFDSQEDISIPLDPKLDGNKNAQRCYTKYAKLKKGQVYLQEQIRLCENEVHYFEGLLEQLELADFDTATEIQEELIKQGYLKVQKKKPKRKKQEEALAIRQITLENGVVISFGRNNLQNESLTFHHSKKTDLWFHAKDYHGAHVVVHQEHPDEETIRFAANIAACFSKGRASSSVPINYCPIKNLKKIPGAKPGMVQLGAYQTIYIDPDPLALERFGFDAS